MLKIFISDLGAYNNGELTGEWHDLETADGRTSAEYAVISIMQPDDGEYFISDFESDHLNVSSFADVTKLCAIGEILEDAGELDTAQLLTEVSENDTDTFSDLAVSSIQDDLNDVLSDYTPVEILNMMHFGDFNPTHDLFKFDGYNNLESFPQHVYDDMLENRHKDIVKYWFQMIHDIEL